MSKKSKYVIVEVFGLEVPIVFSPLIEHVAIAPNLKKVSAGFCNCEEYEKVFNVYGESQSLKLKSRPEDADLLNDSLEIDI
jgi:hypothetical protein